jgi:hypothetical protein
MGDTLDPAMKKRPPTRLVMIRTIGNSTSIINLLTLEYEI